MWWIIGVLAVCIGGACVAQWREWHIKQSTAGRDVETDYLRPDEQPAIGWDEAPGSVMQFAMDEPRRVTHPPRTGRSPMGNLRIGDLPEMFDVVDAEIVPDPWTERLAILDRMRHGLTADGYVSVESRYAALDAARWVPGTNGNGLPEEAPESSLPVRKVNVITPSLPVTREMLEEVEHAGADDTWADELAEIKDGPEGRLLPEGVADPEIEEFYASLSADDIEDARWRAEMAEWDRETERDFRRLDNILEAERQRIIAALTETWGLEFRDECKAIDIRDNEIHQRVVDAELAAIANADTLVMA